MTRSRLVVAGAAVVVSVGAMAALGALYLDPASAAVGPLPPQALSLPAGTRYVMGLDIKRFVASPLYTRYAAARTSNRPQAFEELEQKTGLNPQRDLDQVYVAGSQAGVPGRSGDAPIRVRCMQKVIPGPAGPGTSESIELPALKSLTVTGDLEPQVSLDITGEAADEPAAKNLADVVRGFVALASLQANQKPELKQLASAISVTTEASRVHVAARVPYEVIDSLQPKRAATAPPPSAQ